MAAKEIADEIRSWAAKAGLFQFTTADANYDAAGLRDELGAEGLQAASAILPHRGLSFIGYSESRAEVAIYTKKRVTKGDLEFLPDVAAAGVAIVYKRGGGASAGVTPPPPLNVPPFELHNALYTCGSSVYVGNQIGAGTLGCLVRKNGMLCGLSNNHITGGCNFTQLTLPISAPGIRDILPGQPDPFTIGHHYETATFVDGIPDNVDTSLNLDAALFRIADEGRVSSFQRNAWDTPADVIPLDDNMQQLFKVGRTSAVTTGHVAYVISGAQPIEYFVDVTGSKKIVYLDDVFVIESNPNPFAYRGDSGSLITYVENEHTKYSVGLVVAVDDFGLTYAISLDKVLNYFGVQLISGHNV